jgi:hypothetical protein
MVNFFLWNFFPPIDLLDTVLNGIVANAAWIRFKLCLSEEGSGPRKALEANIWENYLCSADLLSKLGFGTLTEKIAAE